MYFALAMLGAALNLLFWLVLVLGQWYAAESMKGRLRLLDFWTGRIGDPVGLSIVTGAYVVYLFTPISSTMDVSVTLSRMAAIVAVAVAIRALLVHYWRKNARKNPNAGFNSKGELTAAGKRHNLYAGMHVWIASHFLVNAAIWGWTPFHGWASLGYAVLLVTYFLDVRVGNLTLPFSRRA